MTKKSTVQIDELVRRYGTPASPKVGAYVSEVRSDFVGQISCPKLPEGDFTIGAYVIQWDYSLSLTDVREFHEFLRANERFISDSMKKMARGAYYRGTYILLANGDVRYRTVWAYDSLEALAKIWKAAVANRDSNFYKAVKQLRSFWLRDPDRTEGRYVPAAPLFDDDDEPCEDSFGSLTIDAASPGPTQAPSARKRKR